MPMISTRTYGICKLDPSTGEPAYWLKSLTTYAQVEWSNTLEAAKAKTWKTAQGATVYLRLHDQLPNDYIVHQIP